MMKDQKEEVVYYYNNFFNKSDYSLGSLNTEEKRRWDFLEETLNNELFLSKDKRKQISILDFGCGDGRFYPLFSKFGNVDGVDISQDAVKRGNKFLSTNNLRVLDLTESNIAQFFNKKYDIIISTELIEHIPDFEKDFVFKNMKDLLLEGGRIILTTPNGIIKRHHFSGRASWKQPVEDWIKKKELKSKLENQGLKVICHITFYNRWIIERYPKTWLYLFFNIYTVSLFKITKLDALIEFFIRKFRLGFYQLIIAQKNSDE